MGNGNGVFLTDLTLALVAAGLFGALARRLQVTPVLGYVLAGVAIGRFTPSYLGVDQALGGPGELGLILLLFSLGLSFSARDLRGVGIVPALGNLVLMGAFAAAAWALGSALHFPHPITLALVFTLSSTAIGVALLQGFGLLGKRIGQSAVALLVMQDLVAILMLVVTTEPPQELNPSATVVPLLKAALFVIAALAIGATVLHRFTIGVLRRAPAEAMVGFSTGIALVAAWLGHLAGLSFEFGAFVAGAVTSEAAGSRIIQSVVAPFRELFVMVFFVSIGTLVDVDMLLAAWPAILAIGAALVILRFAGWYGLARITRRPRETAVALGIALVPLGEFNVVLANNGYLAHRLNAGEYGAAIGATLLSIAVAAVAARTVHPGRQEYETAGAPARLRFVTAPAIVIVGYGRVGRTVSAICRKAGIPVGIIETDIDLVRLAAREGLEAAYGDGADPAVIDRAIAPGTRVVLSTIPDTAANAGIARRLAPRPHLRVVVRAVRLRDVPALREAGADEVLVPEAEGAFGVAQAVLGEFGVDDERIAGLLREQRKALAY